MNKVILLGRLTKDVDFRDGSTAVAKFSLAVDRKYKKEGDQTADFISCVGFGKTAEFVQKYFAKGSKILVEGRWQTGSYTNKDGQKVYTNDCVVEQVDFADSKKPENKTVDDDTDWVENVQITDNELPFK